MSKLNNAKAWEVLYEKDYVSGGTFLPAWGIYSSGSELTKNLLKLKNKKVLEVACGIGESISYVLKKNPRQYVGIDVAEHALDRANKNYKSKRVSFIHVDISKKFPFSQNSFDEVFSVYGIGWSRNLKKTLLEIYRILKPGGTFTFSWDHYLARVVGGGGDKVLIQQSYNIERPTSHHNWNQTGYDIRSVQAKPSTWFRFLRNAGFEVTEFHEMQAFPHGSKRHSFSNAYQAERARLIPYSILMQARKPL